MNQPNTNGPHRKGRLLYGETLGEAARGVLEEAVGLLEGVEGLMDEIEYIID